jgi:uncharacterized protein (TIGR02466 family)
MNIELWFPTPVLWHDTPCEVSDRIKADFFLKENEIKSTLQNNVWGDNITSSFGADPDFISRFELYELGNVIDEAVHKLAKTFNVGKNLVRKESWVNYQNKYQYQNVHTHTGKIVSACYYIQATPEDGVFRMHPPKAELSTWAGAESHETISYKPRTGLILAFPSSMEHSVSQNLTDNTRISISCNYIFESNK